MGIEPTWDFVEPHTGFEDQERHQVARHLQSAELCCFPGRWPDTTSPAQFTITARPIVQESAVISTGKMKAVVTG